MHILFLSDNFPPEVNAAATRVYERAVYWVKAGHQVTVLTCAPNFPQGKVYKGYKNKWRQVEEIEGIRVVRVKTFISANKGFALRILDFISYMLTSVFFGLFEKRPDVVVATSPQFFAAVGGWLLSMLKWSPFVFELSDLWPASIVAVGAMKKSFLIRCIEKLELFLYRRAKAIISLTEAFKEDLVSRGIQADKITVVRNGVDLHRYVPKEKENELLEKYNLQDKRVIGYIGTHGMAHQLENVLEAAKLLASHNKIQFIFVGEGAEKKKLLEKAQDEKIENVTFIPAQTKAEISRYWGLCDVALIHLKNNPVFSTVIPSKMFEAMAMGLPILLVSPKGEAADVLEQDGAGVWVPAGSPEKLSEEVLVLLKDANLATFREKSLLAAKAHTRQQQADKMLQVLENVKKR